MRWISARRRSSRCRWASRARHSLWRLASSFCCAARWARQAGRQALASGIGFYAAADVHDGRMYLPIVCEKPDAVLEEADLLPPWGEVMPRRASVCPLHIASIASGLMVAEFDRFVAGAGENRELHINLQTMALTVTGLA